MKQFSILVLKGCPCVGASLDSLHVPSGFGGRAGSDVLVSYVFTQGVLAAITMVGGGAGDRGARTGARYDLLLCLVAKKHPIRVGVGSHVAGAEALKFVSKLAPFLLSVCSPSSQHQNPCPRGSRVPYRKRGQVWVHSVGLLAWAVATWPVRVGDHFWCADSISTSNGCPCAVQMLFWVWVGTFPHGWSLLSWQPLP